MFFPSKEILKYCEVHSTPQSEILYELERETNLKTLAPQMSSGSLQGQLLRFISLMIQPKKILEIGTFTGYSAICLSGGLPLGGILHTIEANAELAHLIRKYVKRAGLTGQIQFHIGNAFDIIPTLDGEFNLVFIDGGKSDYARYFDLVIEKVLPGGFILADNVLWSAKVVHKKQDKDTKTIDAFNKKILQDDRVENMIIPFRDGINIIRKIS